MMAESTGLFKSMPVYLLTPRQGLPDYLLSVAAQCLYFLNLGGTGSQIQVTKILGVYESWEESVSSFISSEIIVWSNGTFG